MLTFAATDVASIIVEKDADVQVMRDWLHKNLKLQDSQQLIQRVISYELHGR